MNHLKLKGLDNGTLYRQVAVAYDLCFTRDSGFAHNVRQMRDASHAKVLHVAIRQQRVEVFVTLYSVPRAFRRDIRERFCVCDDRRASHLLKDA